MGNSFARAVRAANPHRRLGLQYEDLFIETPEVEEAIRRMPRDLQEARARRILRASDLSLKKQYLPESEWTPVEQKPYLRPYLDEVMAERKERIVLENR